MYQSNVVLVTWISSRCEYKLRAGRATGGKERDPDLIRIPQIYTRVPAPHGPNNACDFSVRFSNPAKRKSQRRTVPPGRVPPIECSRSISTQSGTAVGGSKNQPNGPNAHRERERVGAGGKVIGLIRLHLIR